MFAHTLRKPKNEDDRATREYILEDLQQQAQLYFFKAMEKFDHTRDKDVVFGAYAKQWIVGGLSKQLLENWTIVSMSARAFRNLNKANLDAMEQLREQGAMLLSWILLTPLNYQRLMLLY